jgi:CBS domain-containing protein
MSATQPHRVDAAEEPPTKPRKSAAEAVTRAKTVRSKATTKSHASRSKTHKRDTLAADVMHSPAICCRAHDNLHEAARLMWEHDLGTVPVVNDADEPVGMLTDRDACMAAYTQGVPLIHGSVASAMSQKVVLCDVTTPLAKIRELMAEARVRRMPVVDAQGKLVGIIGLSDLIREAHAALPKDRRRGSSGPMLVQLVDSILCSP